MTPPHVTVALAQTRSEPADVDAGATGHVEVVRAAATGGAGVVVFPELSLTGYELERIAVDVSLHLTEDDARLSPLRDAVVDTGVTALVGAPVRHASGLLLGCLVLRPSGTVDVYGKRNLFGAERGVFVPGTDPLVVEVSGVRLGAGICADLADDRQAAELVSGHVDAWLLGVLVTPAGYARDAARAAEVARRTGASVLLANHAGPTGGWVPAGRSTRFGADGPGPQLDADGGLPRPAVLNVDVHRRTR